MKLTIEIPDDIEGDVRHAFMQQDKPATDEQLTKACYSYLVGTTARVAESEERAVATTRRKTIFEKAGIEDALASPRADVAEAVERK